MEDTNMSSALGNVNRAEQESGRPQPSGQRADGYEIRVRDHLETYWLNWFEGWEVTNLENGEVLLKGTAVDQSKLHGALNKIRDLNLTLLAVRCVPVDDQTTRPDMGGAQDPAPDHERTSG